MMWKSVSWSCIV